MTCEKEIEYLNILKPDYIGFVFTKSKRQISAFDAKFLRKKLNPEIKCVGVFKDNSLIEINNVLKKVNLDVVQLHGSENFDFINLLKKNENHKFEIWKALSINNKIFLNEYVSYYMRMKNNCVMDNILIDGCNPGSGETYSLAPFMKIIKKHCDLNNDFKFILAGGITPENVLLKIKEANPWGVDVSSGVEDINKDGVTMKSFDKMKVLINKIR
nr:phosphoribosylanthranilate isomerase [Clostridium butyricum]